MDGRTIPNPLNGTLAPLKKSLDIYLTKLLFPLIACCLRLLDLPTKILASWELGKAISAKMG